MLLYWKPLAIACLVYIHSLTKWQAKLLMQLEKVYRYMVKRYAQSNMWPSTSLWTKCFWSSSSM